MTDDVAAGVVRIRHFRGGAYVGTYHCPEEANGMVGLSDEDLGAVLEVGDILYFWDKYMVMTEYGFDDLAADDPRVRGLYSKAVRAERESA